MKNAHDLSIMILYAASWDQREPKVEDSMNKEILHDMLRKRGLKMILSHYRWYKDGVFTRYWHYLGNGVWKQEVQDVKPRAIYDLVSSFSHRTGGTLIVGYQAKKEIAKSYHIFNTPEFTQLMDNKVYQAVCFSEFMPESRYIPAGSVIQNPKGEHVVLKRPGGSGGFFVEISTRKRIVVEETMVRQAFVHGRDKGVLQDFRICFLNRELLYVYSRIAAKDTLYTNVHQGATMVFRTAKDIRNELKITAKILDKLDVFPEKLVSMDFIRDARAKKSYLIEVNTTPGVLNFSEPLLKKYYSKITQQLLS